MKGIRERNGKYQVNITIDGKRSYITVTTLNDAKKIRKEIDRTKDQELIDRLTDKAVSVSYKEAVEEHINQHIKYLKSGDSLERMYSASIKHFNDTPISNITWEDVERYRNERLKVVSAGFVVKELAMMSAVFKRQIKAGNITVNPASKAAISRPRFNNTRERVLSHSEITDIITACRSHYIRLAIVIADYTAMRLGEVLGLQWKDIDLDKQEIYLSDTKNGESRFVPIHKGLVEILLMERENKNADDFVVSRGGNQIGKFYKGFAGAVERAGVSNFHFHDLRHRAITRWVSEGKQVNAIMAASGHKTFSAFKRYANLRKCDIFTLVGHKSEPIPYINVAEMWQTGKYSCTGLRNNVYFQRGSVAQSVRAVES